MYMKVRERERERGKRESLGWHITQTKLGLQREGKEELVRGRRDREGDDINIDKDGPLRDRD